MKVAETPQAPSEGEQAEEAQKTIEQDYQKTVKEEADRKITEETQKGTEEFERIHRLGFSTTKEMLGEIAALRKENEALKAEFTKLREFLLRAKAQGKAVIPTEEKPSESEELKKIYGDLAPEL